MVFFNYSPLFNYLEENGITRETLVQEQVVAEGVLNRMKHKKNIEVATICRIMDFLQITDINLVLKVEEVKDDKAKDYLDCMRYDYYSKKLYKKRR